MYQATVQTIYHQAVGTRKLYLWSALDPRELPYHPMLEHALHLESSFKLHFRQTTFDRARPQVSELHLLTNDLPYGTMMEVRGQCDLSSCPAQASELAGLWAHTYQSDHSFMNWNICIPSG